MKPESSAELQRMLALKRQERPPQRFFKGLSTAVIDRIQHPEPPAPPTLRQKLGLDFDSKPVLVCVLGAVVCALPPSPPISPRHVQAPPPPPRRIPSHRTWASGPLPARWIRRLR